MVCTMFISYQDISKFQWLSSFFRCAYLVGNVQEYITLSLELMGRCIFSNMPVTKKNHHLTSFLSYITKIIRTGTLYNRCNCAWVNAYATGEASKRCLANGFVTFNPYYWEILLCFALNSHPHLYKNFLTRCRFSLHWRYMYIKRV